MAILAMALGSFCLEPFPQLNGSVIVLKSKVTEYSVEIKILDVFASEGCLSFALKT